MSEEEVVAKKKDTRRQTMRLLRMDFERYKLAMDRQLENLKNANAILADKIEKLEKDARLHPLKKLVGVKAK